VAGVLGARSLLCFTWTILTPTISAVTDKTTAKLFCGEQGDTSIQDC